MGRDVQTCVECDVLSLFFVQVRATIEVPGDAEQEAVMALVEADPAVQRWTDVRLHCPLNEHTHKRVRRTKHACTCSNALTHTCVYVCAHWHV